MAHYAFLAASSQQPAASSYSPTTMTPAFGQWLKERRKTLGLTQEELAGRIACAAETLRKFEAGTRYPSGQVAQILADYFSIPDDERDAFVSFARGQQPAGSRRKAESSSALSPQSFALGEHPWRELRHALTNLPAPVTTLIGREREAEQIRGLLLRASVRLLTLTGSPGIGKTRLAQEVSAQLLGHFDDGVFFVPLAPIADPGLVVGAIARTLGVEETKRQSILDALAESLGGKRVLLVLDNFEHVLDAGPPVAQLLADCPWLKVLITSREALHLYGERQYPVPPLEAPSSRSKVPGHSEQLGTLDLELGAVPSVVLFVERAQAVKPDFALGEESAGSVAGICVHLGGLPLAIELAAARTDFLTPQAMLPMLESSLQLQLLSGGARDLPPRQQTLRGAIEWSYNLLDERDCKLFRRLGVFRGGCTPVAAEAVCNPKGDIAGGAARGLESLVNKSLVQPNGEVPEDEPLYIMLEAVREYALEKLEECGETEALKRLHAEFYLALVEAAGQEMGGAHPEVGYDRVEAVRDNLRAALRWARERKEAAMALRMAAVLYAFWYQRGFISEGRAELEAVLAISEGIDSADRAKVLYGIGRLADVQNDYASARTFFLQSLETARKLEDSEASGRAVADALGGLGVVADHLGDQALARQYAEERLAASRALGYGPGILAALTNLGGVALDEGNYELARYYYQEVLELSRKRGDRGKEGSALVNLGLVAAAQGNYEAARALLEEALAIWEERENRLGKAVTLHNLGDVARGEGNNNQALEYYRDAIRLYLELGNKSPVIGVLAGVAGVWRDEGHAERSARLLSAVANLGSMLKYTLLPADQVEYERSLGSVRDALGPERFEAASAKGRAMSLEEAVAYTFNREP